MDQTILMFHILAVLVLADPPEKDAVELGFWKGDPPLIMNRLSWRLCRGYCLQLGVCPL